MTTLDRAILYIGVPLAVVLAAVGVYQTAQIVHRPPPPQRFLTTVNIVITNTAGTCQQTVGGTPYDLVPVDNGAYVTWIPPNTQWSIDVQFLPANSPFYDSSSSKGGVTSGQVSGTANQQFPYNSVTVNGQSCTNAGSLGLIMKP